MILVYVVCIRALVWLFGLKGLVPDRIPPSTVCRRVVVLVPKEEEWFSEGRVSLDSGNVEHVEHVATYLCNGFLDGPCYMLVF